jgi:transcriptional regulator with XRE-family HTH domain
VLTLRQTRELVNASQKQLADAAGLDVNIVTRIEQGRAERLAHESVVRIVRALRRLGIPGVTDDQIVEFHVPEERTAEAVNQ